MKKFKLLIVGSNKTWAIEKLYLKYLAGPGVEVELYATYDKFFDYYERSAFNKIKFKLGISTIHAKINKELEKYVLEKKPDVIWVFKGMEIFPETLIKFKKTGIKLINYNPDSPFIFSGAGSGNKNITDSISIFNLYLTYDAGIKKNIELNYRIKTEILPFGFDLPDELFHKCEAEKEVLRLCFLGNPDKARADFIHQLANANIPVTVFGNDWNKFIKDSRIEINTAVYADGFWTTLRKYRVQLNLMRLHNPSSHNMRSFEVPGVGGIMLAPKTADHCFYFEQDREVFLFENIPECIDQANRLLKLSAGEAMQIRKTARERSLKSGYSYKARAAHVLGLMENLIN